VFTLYFVNQWQTWVIILAIVLLLFGATRLPALSKSLGQSVKSFRKEMQSDDAAPTDPAKADSTPVEPTKPAADKE
jgi:sec-independent protein translocase protein TatA